MAYAASHINRSEAEGRLLQFMAGQCDQYWYYQLRYCVPQLLILLDEATTMSDEQLASQAARLIRDYCPIQDTDEPMNHRHRALEVQIRLITDELERMAFPDRQHDPAAHHVPPQMFG